MIHQTENKLALAEPLRLFIIPAVLFALASVTAYAGQSDVENRLSKSVEQTRQQLEAERQRIADEQESQKKALEEATIRQEKLIDEIVERKFSIARKQALLEKKSGEHENLQLQQDRYKQQWTEIRIIAADALQKLSDFLDILPASESRAVQEDMLAAAKSSLGKAAQTQTGLSRLTDLLESLLQESRTTAVFDCNVRDPRGYQQQVRLLRIGQILFAYKGLSSGRTAIAEAASGDTEGFRWNEDIPQWARRKIGLAIDGANPKGGVYSLPIDVTQQMTYDKGNHGSGFWKKMAAGGPVMIPLAIVAVLSVVLIVERFIFLSEQSGNSVEIAEYILACCHAGNFRQAEQLAIENPTVISRTLLACLSRRLEGRRVMEDAIAESILHELPKLERFLPSIGMLAGVAPLLGLLGTVTGMISTFDTITMFGSGRPRLMAGGISEALLTTAAGLAIAIPVLLIHNFLSSRADRLVADTERFSATLLNLLGEQSNKHNTGG
jgi:biopolymer transport protein ExbB